MYSALMPLVPAVARGTSLSGCREGGLIVPPAKRGSLEWKDNISAGHQGKVAYVIHGHARKTGTSPTYRSWHGLIQRCTNPLNPKFPRYGGRGITVCERWIHSFANFLTDMGERPANLTIDRIDNDGDYEPSNCRWATAKEQRANQTRIPITHCKRDHLLEGANVYLKDGRRHCRTCRMLQMRRQRGKA